MEKRSYDTTLVLVCFTMACISAGLLAFFPSMPVVFRVIAGIIVTVLPGAFWTYALFPNTVPLVERLSIGIVCSMVLIAFAAYAMNSIAHLALSRGTLLAMLLVVSAAGAGLAFSHQKKIT